MKHKIIIIFAVALVLLAGCAAPAEQLPEQETSAQQTTAAAQTVNPAPDFTVYDLEGNPVSLSDFVGKPVVLNFWASWCGPCKSEMPDFDAACKELGDQVQFLMVNLTDGTSETVETAHAYVQSQGFTFPVFYDTDMDAANTYGIYSIPTTYFLDEKGQLVAQARGAIDAQTLQKGIDMILAK